MILQLIIFKLNGLKLKVLKQNLSSTRKQIKEKRNKSYYRNSQIAVGET